MSAKVTPKSTPSNPGKEVIYLDVDDDITTIIDKVEGAKNKVVAVVLPKRFATLQSIVNMRLLKRSADTASKKIVLVTSDAALAPLAGAAGIHVAKNLQSKPEIPPSPIEAPPPKPAISEDPDAEIDADAVKLDYHRSIGELAAAKVVDEPETIPLEDDEEGEKKTAAVKPPKGKKIRIPNFERFRLLLALGALGVILLVTFLIMAIFVLPKATITLRTEATPISASFELKTSGNATKLDMKQGIIPAVLKKSDLTSEQQVQATGQQNKGKKATGSVTMTARACAPNLDDVPKDVPAGTGISTNGIYYITRENAKFSIDYPDGSCNYYKSDSISIVAQEGGSKYNISNATFSVTSRSDVSASGSASGGTDDIVKILSQSDVDAVADKIGDQDKIEFVEKFKKELGEQGLYLIEESIKDSSPKVSASPAVGQPASSANVTVKITYSVLTLKKDDLEKAVTEELNKQIDKNRQKIGTDDVLKDVQVNIQSQSSSTVAILTITEDTTAVPIINENAVKTQVGGQKAGEIKALLGNYPGVKEVEVHMSPFWVSKAPKKPGKITVILEQVKTEETQDSGSR